MTLKLGQVTKTDVTVWSWMNVMLSTSKLWKILLAYILQLQEKSNVIVVLLLVSSNSLMVRWTLNHHDIDRQILGVVRPVNREGLYQGETKCIPARSTHSDLQLNSIYNPLLKICRTSEKMKLNEPGRQKLGRYGKPCKQAQHTKLYSDLLQA